MNNVAIIIPHGDDEILGFYGAITKHLQKNDFVSVCYLITPRDARTHDQYIVSQKIKEVLNYNEVAYLEYSEHDIHLNKFRLINELDNFVQKNKINFVYTTSYSDSHQTHRLCFDAVYSCARISNKQKINNIILGEIPSSTNSSPLIESRLFVPNHFIELSQEDVNRKIELLKLYKYEFFNYPHPRSEEGIKTFARFRGMQVGVSFAEAYQIIRSKYE
jgi:LmbE family N-acetylglucosaminyl deacetylase